jgi:REP element-mobilizing transposase RayT
MLSERKKLPHGVPSWVEDGAIYFVTINCRPRSQNQLCHDVVARALKESVCFRHQRREWWVRLVVLMPDHVHMLMSFSREVSMAKSVSSWKRFVARDLGVEWQDGFFDHRIRDVASLQEKESYIAMNPVRKGLCSTPEDWPYIWRAADFER